ncbi:hypothetical protein BIFCAT_01974 [Bifidobacterium catenulatum DSM 16992 = JCM 1194 = LMG 11043]|uniref:Uncharacterized protein n=1 Tax=Bifidobacterium catenulatum DSM 16992 = JCM 1194 = LMG 11043 TaxID=566552 RepID=B6XXL3_9BIFI|nr:hypothetical protein BIFCAT_01974 [Bifidobacterium catenulatum DSM 16992 = JCM 1194 = LMG 11043]
MMLTVMREIWIWGEKETKIVVCPSYGGMPAIYGIGCRYYGRQCR